jgi:hypothetical protein
MKKFIGFLLDVFVIFCTIVIMLIVGGIFFGMLITPLWYFIALGNCWYLAAYLPLILAIILTIYDRMRE